MGSKGVINPWDNIAPTISQQFYSLLGGNRMSIGIYKITNKINGKSYIGLSSNIEERFKSIAKCKERKSYTLLLKSTA